MRTMTSAQFRLDDASIPLFALTAAMIQNKSADKYLAPHLNSPYFKSVAKLAKSAEIMMSPYIPNKDLHNRVIELSKRDHLLKPFKEDYKNGYLGSIEQCGNSVEMICRYEYLDQLCRTFNRDEVTPGAILLGFNLKLADIPFEIPTETSSYSAKDGIATLCKFKNIQDTNIQHRTTRQIKNIARTTISAHLSTTTISSKQESIQIVRNALPDRFKILTIVDRTIYSWIDDLLPETIKKPGRKRKRPSVN